MIDRVEERFQVAIHGVAAAFLPAGFHCGHRLMGGSTGPEAITVFAEVRFEKRPQHLRDRLLDHAIQHRRHGVFILLVLQESFGMGNVLVGMRGGRRT